MEEEEFFKYQTDKDYSPAILINEFLPKKELKKAIIS